MSRWISKYYRKQVRNFDEEFGSDVATWLCVNGLPKFHQFYSFMILQTTTDTSVQPMGSLCMPMYSWCRQILRDLPVPIKRKMVSPLQKSQKVTMELPPLGRGGGGGGGAPINQTLIILSPNGSWQRKIRSVTFATEIIRLNRVQRRLMNGLKSVRKKNIARRVGPRTTPWKIAKAKSRVPAVLVQKSPIRGDITQPFVLKLMAIQKNIKKQILSMKGKIANQKRVNCPKYVIQR
jgi:hypothetical protein